MKRNEDRILKCINYIGDICRSKKLHCNKTTEMTDVIQKNSLFIIRFFVHEIFTYHLLFLVLSPFLESYQQTEISSLFSDEN